MSHADALHPNPEIAKRLAYIYTLHRKDMDFRLAGSPYEALLNALGDPHKHLPPVVHVAGTNGKGSTIAFLRAMCEAAGLRVHVYTSPHLLVFNERIRLAGQLIDDSKLLALYDRVYAANNGQALTFFEFTTALAFLAFAETPADIVLLEVGLGGRFDCTNIIPTAALSVITKISYDHMDMLGAALPDIAYQKAGIMKQGVPCVVAPQMDAAAVMPVFIAEAETQKAPLYNVAMPTALAKGRGFKCGGATWPMPALHGAHQIENAATALTAAAILDHMGVVTVPQAACTQGLQFVAWPGRLQHITEGPVADDLPPAIELWFDAAHNDSGAQALAAQCMAWRRAAPDMPIYLIAGLGADKDATAFFGPLHALCDGMVLVDVPNARKPRTAVELAASLPAGVTPLALAPHISGALGHIKPTLKGHARIIVAGSLYLYSTLFAAAQ